MLRCYQNLKDNIAWVITCSRIKSLLLIGNHKINSKTGSRWIEYNTMERKDMRQSIGVYRNDISGRLMSGCMYCFQGAVCISTFTEVLTTCVDIFWQLRLYLVFDAFAKLRKATISFVISVRPSVRLSVCTYGKARLPLDRFS